MVKRILSLLIFLLVVLKTQAQAPTITSFSPDSGSVGTLITVVGTNLGRATGFIVGGANAIVVSDTAVLLSNYGDTLVGMVMPGSVTGKVSVSTAGGTVFSGNDFIVKATSFPSVQQGSKLVGTGANDTTYNAIQGYSCSISADGNTAIVGGIGNNNEVGAAWIFTRSAGVWSQQGNKLVGTGAVGKSQQGTSVAISADGNTAVIGGYGDNGGEGAVWIFIRSNGVWAQQGNKLVGTGAMFNANQGVSVSISADGNTFIIGGLWDNMGVGAVWVFTRAGGIWTQQGNKLVGTGGIDGTYGESQGTSVSISEDGNTLIEGGNYDNNNIGAVWVFARSGGIWAQQGNKLVGTGAVGGAWQGASVKIAADGNTAIVGGPADNTEVGAAWVYTRTAGAWSQQGKKLVGTGAIGNSGQSCVSITADGNTAVVGGHQDNSDSGAVWVYTRTSGIWTQRGNKLIGSGAIGSSEQGACFISADGNTLIDGGSFDNNDAGAAWVFVSSSYVASVQNYFSDNSINSQIYPNPFFSTTTIKFSITSQSLVKLELYDMDGKKVETLVDGVRAGGQYEVALNNAGYANGMYFYRLQIGENVETKKLIIQ